ncbi:hypothetical protein HZS_4948 [Henneguya salminicola]|nr:hypothetical protein HZS_4948 [Henneguya salminicola]
MDDIFSQSCRLVTRRRKSYTALFKLKTEKEEAGDAEDEREGDGEDESVETDALEMHVDIIESFEIHSDDDFEGFE